MVIGVLLLHMETEEKKVYTIEDIARELGVSKTTVSRAISGKGRIGQATRDEGACSLSKEHDYRPNVDGERDWPREKTYNLALLDAQGLCCYRVSVFQRLYEWNLRGCVQPTIMIFSFRWLTGKMCHRYERLEANRKVDGIIVSRAVVSSKAQKYLKKLQRSLLW